MDRTSPEPWQVICLCAAWCGVCRDWQPQFQALASQHPGVRFAWIDVEDEDEAMGDVEIDTFPTVLVAHGVHAMFLGPIPPFPKQLSQLLVRLQAQAEPAQLTPADALLARLAPLLPRARV